MLEYLHLMNAAEDQTIPLGQRRKVLDVLNHMVQYMNPEEHSRYQAISNTTRKQLEEITMQFPRKH